MPLIHHVHFNNVREMIIAVAEVYTQFNPHEPLPSWWTAFVAWSEEKGLQTMGQLQLALEKVEKAKKKPKWWSLAERDVKAAPSVKTMRIQSEPFEGDDDEDEECAIAREKPDEAQDDDGTDEDAEDDGADDGANDGEDAGDDDSDDDGQGEDGDDDTADGGDA